VVTIVLGVAAGLHCAHERRGVDGRPLGIVHRDLSPGNVFITEEGGVKLLDFGIAKATSRTSITIGPSRKGKVAYMSPEQCLGHEIDRCSDVFALGIVAWELCTGKRLNRGDNEFAIMNRITTIDAPSPCEHAPELPPELGAIILRALRRDPDERYQTAMELHDAVEALAAARGLMPSPTALGRYLAQICGQREHPSGEPSGEFVGLGRNTLVVRGAKAEQNRRSRWSVPLALAGGVTLGAIAVALASSDPVAASPSSEAVSTPAAADTAASSAAPVPTASPPASSQTTAPSGAATVASSPAIEPVPATDPTAMPAETPTQAGVETTTTDPAARPTRRGSSRKRGKTPRPEPTAGKPERGVDGILPSG
jgi:serine/threonine protein kinase